MIEVNGVRKGFGKFQMEDITFELPSGYICGLVGQNGAGKTTLLHLLLGLYKADAGEIMIDTMDYVEKEKRIHDSIGTVLVEELFLSELSIRENADYFGRYYSDYSWDKMAEYLKMFNLAEVETGKGEHSTRERNGRNGSGAPLLGNRRFGKLSKGQKLKCQFAFALSHDPDILILDEPTGNFDPDFREQFFKILKEFISDGTKTVILATHLTEDIDRLADYLIYLKGGKQVFAGDIESFRNEYRIVSGEAYKLKLIPKERLINIEDKKYGARALVHHRKYYKYDPEVQVSVPTIEEFMYLYSRRAKTE